MKLKAVQILIAAFLLTPLAAIAQSAQTVSDETLARRAAFALNTTPDKVRIFDRQVDADNAWRVNFMAERDGKKFQCYLAAIPGTVSDAMCAGTDGTMDGVRCDPLSKAAGRC